MIVSKPANLRMIAMMDDTEEARGEMMAFVRGKTLHLVKYRLMLRSLRWLLLLALRQQVGEQAVH